MQIALMLPTKYLLQSSHPTQVWLPNTKKRMQKGKNKPCQQTSITGIAHKPGTTNNCYCCTQFSKQVALQTVLLFLLVLYCLHLFKYMLHSRCTTSIHFRTKLSKKGLLAYIQCCFIKVNKNICPQQTKHLTVLNNVA